MLTFGYVDLCGTSRATLPVSYADNLHCEQWAGAIVLFTGLTYVFCPEVGHLFSGIRTFYEHR